MAQERVSVVITSYNEKGRLLSVLDAVTKLENIHEIILVDDGSDEFSKTHIRQAEILYPNINMLKHTNNCGKSAGLKTGIEKAQGDIIFLLDADLNNLTTKHLSGMITSYLNSPIDILLSDRGSMTLFNRMLGFETILTGDRIIRKEIFINNPEMFAANGYLFEVSMNRISFDKYAIGKYKLPKVSQTYKVFKVGYKGLLEDVLMFKNIINFLGFKEFIRQRQYANKLIDVSE